MNDDLKMCEELSKNVIKNGFDKTIKDLTQKILNEPHNSNLYFYKAMLNIQNCKFEDADLDIENAKKYSNKLPSMRDFYLKSGLIFLEYLKSNPNIDFASKFINLKRAEYSCDLAFWTSNDKETEAAVVNLKKYRKEFQKNNKENYKVLENAVNTMCKLYKKNKYDEAIEVGNNAISKLGYHPYIVENLDAIKKKQS